MLILAFEGWFQCRLATDPDPTNEKWGITGATFSGPGEAPLDRIIRFQDPVDLRYPFEAKDFGVNVTSVYVSSTNFEGQEVPVNQPDHPLVGSKVELLDDAMYHQRNYIVIEGLNSPIDPFHVRVTSVDGKMVIDRDDILVLTNPKATLEEMFLDPTTIARRSQNGPTVGKSPELVEATGIGDYIKYWKIRQEVLETKLKSATDETEIAALKKRLIYIDEMEHDSGTRVDARQFIGLLSPYEVDINGDAIIDASTTELGGSIGVSQPWPMKFWMGAYDVDLMLGYTKGTLSLPFFKEN